MSNFENKNAILSQFLNLNEEEKVEKKKESSPLRFQESTSVEKDFSQTEFQEFSKEILNTLQRKVPAQKFQTYFSKGFEVIDIRQMNMIIQLPTNFIKNMMESHYQNFIEDAVEQALGQKYEISFISMQEPTANQEVKTKDNTLSIDLNESLNPSIEDQAPIKNKKASFKLNDFIPHPEEEKHIIQSKEINKVHSSKILGINKTKTFENFIVGNSNNMAFATSVAIAKKPGETYPSVYIHGNSGLGKTHLVHAVANKIHEIHPEQSIVVVSANNFMGEMIQAIKDNKHDEFRKKYTDKLDVLIIDDIHELKNKEGTQNEFFHVFNALHQKKKQLIFTSDKHPSNIKGIAERVKTRLSWGLVLEVQRPDFETRIAILKKKALEMDLFLTDNVIELIAKNIQSNIRELEGSLVQLFAYSSIHNIDIDYKIAREYLKLDEQAKEVKSLDIEDIVENISEYYTVSINDLIGKARLKEIVQARHMAMYVCYEQGKKTQKDIAEYFGGRDHTSVLHAVKKVKEQLKVDTQLIEHYNQILARLFK